LDHAPITLKQWLAIPEQSLAVCTNGRVFHDPLGDFSGLRNALKKFYPRDVQLKKIASRCVTIAQFGQYNFERSLTRGESVAARYAEAMFCADVISMVFLLNRRYTPFYKWMHRAVRDLPLLGSDIHGMIHTLATLSDTHAKIRMIEKICTLLIETLQHQGMTDATSDFLLDHAHSVHSRIEDEELGRRFHVVK
jgi:hypothetical protein